MDNVALSRYAAARMDDSNLYQILKYQRVTTNGITVMESTNDAPMALGRAIQRILELQRRDQPVGE